MKSCAASIALVFLLACTSCPVQAQNQTWPKNEYGTIQLTGERQFEGQEVTRKSFQQRVQAWFVSNLEPTLLVENGRLSARGEFYGWGRFAAIKAGSTDYQLLAGVAARLVEGECTYRIEDLKCVYQNNGKAVTVPLEKFLESTNPEHKLAAAAFRQRLTEFVAAL